MEDVKQRFEEKFVTIPETDCWWWTASMRNEDGYGGFCFKGKVWLAHRVSYELYVGSIPEGLCVLHRCDNPKCVNPDHLFLGTQIENIEDRVGKGRNGSSNGSSNIKSKLTEKIVADIRASDLSCEVLSKKYGVTPSAISHARTGRTWKHVS